MFIPTSSAQFGEMSLFGIDELLTYHYLIVETSALVKSHPTILAYEHGHTGRPCVEGVVR